jgi:hypothetical protein
MQPLARTVLPCTQMNIPFQEPFGKQGTALQRKIKIVDQSPWDTTAPSGALMVRTGIQDKLALAGQAQEVLAEHTVYRFIEAHDIERSLNNTVLDPEGGKTGHAGHATGRAIRVVEVPDVIDVDPGLEAL